MLLLVAITDYLSQKIIAEISLLKRHIAIEIKFKIGNWEKWKDTLLVLSTHWVTDGNNHTPHHQR